MKKLLSGGIELLTLIVIMQIIGSCQQCNTNSKLDKLIELQEIRK